MKRNVKTAPAWLRLAGQVGLILLISFGFCAIGAALITGGIVPQNMLEITSLACLILGTAIGCRFALNVGTKGKLIRVGILTSITAFLLLLGNLLFVQTAPHGWLQVIAAVTIGGGLAILTVLGCRKRAGKRH